MLGVTYAFHIILFMWAIWGSNSAPTYSMKCPSHEDENTIINQTT